ncbi:uncharacterized protein [Choristoneura fumiferana]|uniref:uncharacterized protein n=1 Tax=Choristoneura fumiferana TaxID=7141 RepID=UPI003D157812
MADEDKKHTEKKKISFVGSVGPLSLKGNLAANWKKWLQCFKIYMVAGGLEDESNERKVAIFLHLIGEDALQLYNSFDLSGKVTYETVIDKFEGYCVPRTNITFEAFNFFNRKQKEDESIEDFITDLKIKCKSCEFGTLADRLVRDVFICNLNEKYQFIREKLLQEENLTLDKTISLSKTLIMSQTQANQLSKKDLESTSVLYVKSKMQQSQASPLSQSRPESQSRAPRPPFQSYSRRPMSQSHQYTQSQPEPRCGRCGQVHRFRCPAADVKCRNCHRIGHYESLCRFRNAKVHYVQMDNSIDVPEESGNYDWNINLHINNTKIVCTLDTGSDANVMSIDVYNSLKISNSLMPSDVRVTSYSGNNVKIVGQQDILCQYSLNKKLLSKKINFIIADVKSPTVIGKITCSELGLVRRVYSIAQLKEMSNSYSETTCHKTNVADSSEKSFNKSNLVLQDLLKNNESVFDGLGCLPGKCHIAVDPNVSPKIDAPRKIPFALHDRLKQELDHMEELDVITKVTEPTAWLNVLSG